MLKTPLFTGEARSRGWLGSLFQSVCRVLRFWRFDWPNRGEMRLVYASIDWPSFYSQRRLFSLADHFSQGNAFFLAFYVATFLRNNDLIDTLTSRKIKKQLRRQYGSTSFYIFLDFKLADIWLLSFVIYQAQLTYKINIYFHWVRSSVTSLRIKNTIIYIKNTTIFKEMEFITRSEIIRKKKEDNFHRRYGLRNWTLGGYVGWIEKLCRRLQQGADWCVERQRLARNELRFRRA